jgi:hypothetical protein
MSFEPAGWRVLRKTDGDRALILSPGAFVRRCPKMSRFFRFCFLRSSYSIEEIAKSLYLLGSRQCSVGEPNWI